MTYSVFGFGKNISGPLPPYIGGRLSRVMNSCRRGRDSAGLRILKGQKCKEIYEEIVRSIKRRGGRGRGVEDRKGNKLMVAIKGVGLRGEIMLVRSRRNRTVRHSS